LACAALPAQPGVQPGAGIMGGARGLGTSGMGGYDGPALLGRGGFGVGAQGGRGIPITASMGVAGSYDTNILGFSVDENGNFAPSNSFGVEGTVNVAGQKRFRRSYVGLNYLAGYSHYNRVTFFNGSNQFLSVSGATQLNAKWAITAEAGAGISNRFLGSYGFTGASELEFINLPASELFDSRIVFGGAAMNATYFKSSRQSFRFGGNASTARRKARSLADMRSYGANADWVYRLSRRTSVGLQYTFTHFDFEKIFGETDMHMVGVSLARQVGRDWQYSVELTGFQQSTVGVRTIQLDPVLVALLGRSSGAEVFESNNYLYGFSGSATRNVRRGSFMARAGRRVIPGNGFFITAVDSSASVNATYTPNSKWSFSTSAGYGRMSSLAFASGVFKGWLASVSSQYAVTRDISMVLRYDTREYNLTQSRFSRNGHRVSLGLNWNPQRELLTID